MAISKGGFYAFCLAGILTSGMALAEIDIAQRDQIIGQFRANGCTMTAGQVESVQTDLALTEGAWAGIADDLVARGFATVNVDEAGAFSLTPAFCGVSHASVREVLIAGVRFNGCAMSNEQAPILLPPMGLTQVMVEAVWPGMEDAGEVTVVDGVLSLSEALCAGPAS